MKSRPGELKHLKAMNLIAVPHGINRATVKQYKDKNEKFDLKLFFYITEQGREYIRLRRELLSESWPGIDPQ